MHGPRRSLARRTSASTPPRAQPPDQALSARLPALATAAYYSGQAYAAEASWLVINLGQDIAMSDISAVAMDITALNNNGYERDQSCLLVQWISDTGAVLQTNRNNRVRTPWQGLFASCSCAPACVQGNHHRSGSNTKRHQPLSFAPAGPAVYLLLLPRAAGRYATTLTWVLWVLRGHAQQGWPGAAAGADRCATAWLASIAHPPAGQHSAPPLPGHPPRCCCAPACSAALHAPHGRRALPSGPLQACAERQLA